MADIRTTGWLDDFNRPNVNPIDGNWAKADLSYGTTLRIQNNRAEGNVGDTMYYYTGPEGGPYDGDCEVWGEGGPGSDLTEAWRLGLLKDVGGTSTIDGYQLLCITGIGGSDWIIRKYTNFAFSVIASGTAAGLGAGQFALLRRNGNDIEAWRSGDSGANWNLVVSVTDTTYMSGIYLCMGISSDDGGNPSWEGIGGGGSGAWVPQIIRRQHLRGGIPRSR